MTANLSVIDNFYQMLVNDLQAVPLTDNEELNMTDNKSETIQLTALAELLREDDFEAISVEFCKGDIQALAQNKIKSSGCPKLYTYKAPKELFAIGDFALVSRYAEAESVSLARVIAVAPGSALQEEAFEGPFKWALAKIDFTESLKQWDAETSLVLELKRKKRAVQKRQALQALYSALGEEPGDSLQGLLNGSDDKE